ncbi:MAG: hypothetical protein N2Z71_06695, partial [Caloramator sp.]|nr:hypothetical protein [Caloramator sp.]
MNKVYSFIERYNSSIKKRGKRKYAVRLFITSLFQTLAILFIPSMIDNKYDFLKEKFIVIFIFLLLW